MSIFHNTYSEYATESNNSSFSDKRETCALKSLWSAVITQALMDASSNSKKMFAKKQKVEALRWLLDEKNNEDFKRVCCLADLDYQESLAKVKKALVNGCKWRNDKKENTPIF
jgi:hypothetical protein